MKKLQEKENRFRRFLNRSDVRILLKVLIDGELTELKPELGQSGEFTYPDAERIMGSSSSKVKEVLELLVGEKILIREEFATVLTCPYCGENRFIVDLSDTKVSTTTRPEALESILGHLLGKKLICISGKHVFHEGEGVPKKIYSYRLNQEKRGLVEKWAMDLRPLIESFKARGWRVESPARIRGMSGVEHAFTLAISYRADSKYLDAIVDIIVSDKPVDESALSMVLKAMDVKADKKLLLVVPSLSDKARALFDYYKNYEVYVLECQTIGQINEVLSEILMSLAKIKLKDS
ncbi:MAG: hypothetical protein ACUVQY_07395 [Thermoproteota archaeon]